MALRLRVLGVSALIEVSIVSPKFQRRDAEYAETRSRSTQSFQLGQAEQKRHAVSQTTTKHCIPVITTLTSIGSDLILTAAR